MSPSLALLVLTQLPAQAGARQQLAACHQAYVEARSEVAELTAELDHAQARLATCESDLAANTAPTQDQEEAARLLYTQAGDALGAGDAARAKVLVDELMEKYPSARTAYSARRMANELATVGTRPSMITASKWFVGADPGWQGVQVALFFEEWCPHCKREMPRIVELHERHSAAGLGVVAFTKVSKSSTDDKVAEMLSESRVAFPVAKDTGEVHEFFVVTGIPAAAVVVDGEVVWRGHPARLTDQMIEGWLRR